MGAHTSAQVLALGGAEPCLLGGAGLLFWVGVPYVWVAGVVALGSFGILVSFRSPAVLARTAMALAAIFFCGLSLLQTTSLLWFLVSFEGLLLVSLYLLRISAKADRAEEAALEMLVWALASSFGLLFAFGWLFSTGCWGFGDLQTTSTPTFVFLVAVLALAVKVPMWPAFSWLVRAHVEASVEFSILLSGFIIKVGAWGIFQLLTWGAPAPVSLFLGALSVLSMSVATLRLLAQRDLKRMVAYMTIIETNWLVLCLSCGSAPFTHVAFFLMAVHGFTTALGFLFVEALGRRFHTRDWTQISGLYVSSPLLWALSLALLLLLVGFPGTPLFFAKVLFLTLLYPLAPALAVYVSLLFLVVIPLLLFRVWVSM